METSLLRELWRGAHSMPRVIELMALGATKTSIARRFGISRPTLDKYLKETAAAPSTDGGMNEPEANLSTTNVDSTASATGCETQLPEGGE